MWFHLSPLAAIVQAHYDLNVSPLLPHPSFSTGVIQQHVCREAEQSQKQELIFHIYI